MRSYSDRNYPETLFTDKTNSNSSNCSQIVFPDFSHFDFLGNLLLFSSNKASSFVWNFQIHCFIMSLLCFKQFAVLNFVEVVVGELLSLPFISFGLSSVWKLVSLINLKRKRGIYFEFIAKLATFK